MFTSNGEPCGAHGRKERQEHMRIRNIPPVALALIVAASAALAQHDPLAAVRARSEIAARAIRGAFGAEVDRLRDLEAVALARLDRENQETAQAMLADARNRQAQAQEAQTQTRAEASAKALAEYRDKDPAEKTKRIEAATKAVEAARAALDAAIKRLADLQPPPKVEPATTPEGASPARVSQPATAKPDAR
jgi:hypothetical protein